MFVYTFAILVQPEKLRPFLSYFVLSLVSWYTKRYRENHFNFAVGLGYVYEGKMTFVRWMIDLICQFVGVLLAFFVVRHMRHR